MQRKEMFDVAFAFWPTWLTYALVPLTMYFQVAWFGAIVLAIIFLLPRLWWSCVFGLANWMSLAAGIVACSFIAIRGLL
ncbi:hypothetical protein [Rhodopirellula halodulae]|uniref:hypothetical protein n=1 Tax=Rhodopirellula halodulae TaxID=2894198 RepID=UPI001E4525FA|nr:hypothetical protein [Rhodopirellula sp. JC737]MCC9654622.1 hypothetical protein [Rhodopirellula sp. JC737]